MSSAATPFASRSSETDVRQLMQGIGRAAVGAAE
jgi:hypothetical protein